MDEAAAAAQRFASAVHHLSSPNVTEATRKDAESTLLQFRDLEAADRVALHFLVGVGAQHADETVQFFALQLLHHKVTDGHWAKLTEDRKEAIRQALISLALREPQTSNSRLVDKKCASVISRLACLHWPQDWPNLLPLLFDAQKPRPLAIALEVLTDIADEFAACGATILKRRMDILVGLQGTSSGVLSTVSRFVDLLRSGGLSPDIAESRIVLKALLEALRPLVGIYLVDTCLASRIDDLIALSLPLHQSEALSLLSEVAVELGRKKHGSSPAATISLSDLGRFCRTLSQLTLTCVGRWSLERLDLAVQIQLAQIVKEFLEKTSESLVKRLPAECLGQFWRNCVWTITAHPSNVVAAYGIASAGFIVDRVCNLSQSSSLSNGTANPATTSCTSPQTSPLPSWLALDEYLGLFLLRLLRIGDPAVVPFLRHLCTPAPPSRVIWEVDNTIEEIIDKMNIRRYLPPTIIPHPSTATSNRPAPVGRTALVSAMTLLEDAVEAGEDPDDDNESDSDSTAMADKKELSVTANRLATAASFGPRYAALKASATTVILSLWGTSSVTRKYLFEVINFLSREFFSSNAFKNPWDALESLKAAGIPPNALTERNKSWLSPLYVLLDSICVPFEIVSAQLRTAALKPTANSSIPTSDNTDWGRLACEVHSAIMSLPFNQPITKCTHFWEIRRLDFIGDTSVFLEISREHLDPKVVLDLVFSNIFVGSTDTAPESQIPNATPTVAAPVLITGTVENWSDQTYLIRRRALYALISLCRDSSKALGPFLEPIVSQVHARMSRCTLHDTERALLIESLMSAAAATRRFTTQCQFVDQVCLPYIDTFCNPPYASLNKSPSSLLQHFFGEQISVMASAASAEPFAENRRALARILNQLEATIKRTIVPLTDPASMSHGGYLAPKDPTAPSEDALEALLLQNEACDISSSISPSVNHPLTPHVKRMIPHFAAWMSSLSAMWSPPVIADFPWALPELQVGEEEWQAVAGTSVNVRETVMGAFPIPPELDPESVWLARRHGYHLRVLMFRTFGIMATVPSGFYTFPAIQTVLRDFFVALLEEMPISHVEPLVKHVWLPIFSEENLCAGLFNFPAVGFLGIVLPPILLKITQRLEAEWEILNVTRVSLSGVKEGNASLGLPGTGSSLPSGIGTVQSENTALQSKTSQYLFRVYATTNTSLLVLQLIGRLLQVRGSTVQRAEENLILAKDTAKRSPGAGRNKKSRGLSLTNKNGVAAISDTEEDANTSPTAKPEPDGDGLVYATESKISAFKHRLFGSSKVTIALLQVCASFLRCPDVKVITESHRILRNYAKTSTKNFAPIHEETNKMLAGIYQAVVSSIFNPPPFDPSSFTVIESPNTAVGDRSATTPLETYFADPQGHASVVTATAYECLRGMTRWLGALCARAGGRQYDLEAVVLNPSLYEAILVLSKLPNPLENGEKLQSFTTELLLRKEQHDSKSVKDILRSVVSANLVGFGGAAAQKKLSSDSPFSIPVGFLVQSGKEKRKRESATRNDISQLSGPRDGNAILASLFA